MVAFGHKQRPSAEDYLGLDRYRLAHVIHWVFGEHGHRSEYRSACTRRAAEAAIPSREIAAATPTVHWAQLMRAGFTTSQ
jgi:hypothetical protein